MAVRPIKFNSNGSIDIYHDEYNHGGIIQPTDLRYAKNQDGTENKDVILMRCPVPGCDSFSLHPSSGGCDPENVKRLFELNIPSGLTLADVQAAKITHIEEASNQYLQTFQSPALGAPHTYLSTSKDIPLLDGEYAYVAGPDYKGEVIPWYTIEEGIKDHTGAQFRQMWLDGRSNLRAINAKVGGLVAQVQEATTVEEVNAVEVTFP